MMADAPNANTAASCTEQVECVTFAESVAMSEEESPCINVCTLDKDGEYCTACGQTLEELMR